MDSISQFALGAAVGVAAMGRRTALWKAALWGGIAGTLPDLDVLIDHGDPILNMVQHRAETHAPFWLTMFSLPFALAVARLNRDWALWRRWWLALWLALVTHPLLDALAAQGIAAERLLVMPTAFNSVLWRVVALDGTHYHEGFRSLLDVGPRMVFDRFERGTALQGELLGFDGVRRIADFSHGFYKLHADGNRLRITDLRMGQEPAYTFSFVLAERHSPTVELRPSMQSGSRPDIGRVLPWLWRRAAGEQLPPPR